MNVQNPLVSIIMPVYNAESWIKDAIESVLHQTYSNWELLIGDDASQDKTRFLINTFKEKRIQKFFYDENLGPAIVAHDLISKSKGEYIIRIDADDIMTHDRIQKQLSVFLENKDIALVIASVDIIDMSGNIFKRQDRFPSEDADIRKYIKKKRSIPCQGLAVMMYPRPLYDLVGGFRSFFSKIGGEDIDLFLRLIEHGKIIKIKKVLYYYRDNLDSFSKKLSTNVLKLNSEKIAFFLNDQRMKNSQKIDSLSGLENNLLKDFEKKINDKYEKNPSLIYSHYYCSKALTYNQRIDYCLNAIKIQPRTLKHWRYLIKLFVLKILSNYFRIQ